MTEKDRLVEMGKRIKMYRERAGMTQLELAKKIGVNYPAISKYELGLVKNPPLDTIGAIADALGVKPAVLCCWEDIPVEYYRVNPKNNEIEKKRAELHEMLNEVPESQLTMFDMILRLSTSDRNELATKIEQAPDDEPI